MLERTQNSWNSSGEVEVKEVRSSHRGTTHFPGLYSVEFHQQFAATDESL